MDTVHNAQRQKRNDHGDLVAGQRNSRARRHRGVRLAWAVSPTNRLPWGPSSSYPSVGWINSPASPLSPGLISAQVTLILVLEILIYALRVGRAMVGVEYSKRAGA